MEFYPHRVIDTVIWGEYDDTQVFWRVENAISDEDGKLLAEQNQQIHLFTVDRYPDNYSEETKDYLRLLFHKRISIKTVKDKDDACKRNFMLHIGRSTYPYKRYSLRTGLSTPLRWQRLLSVQPITQSEQLESFQDDLIDWVTDKITSSVEPIVPSGGSQIFESLSQNSSRNASSHGGSEFGKMSREASGHGGSAFAPST